MAINDLLKVQFTSRDGKLKNIFTVIEINGAKAYSCIPCSINYMNAFSLIQHAEGKRHKSMTDSLEVKRSNTTTHVKVEDSNLQATIDDIKDQAMIGLEYIIEVPSIVNLESTYHCVLCRRKFDRISRLISHLTDYKHRLKYLKKHFPTVFEQISDLTEAVCEGIESHFGRLYFLLVENSKFTENRTEFINTVLDSKHIDEDMGRTFVEIIQKGTAKDFEEKGKKRDLKSSFDVISISSDSCGGENEPCKSDDVTPLDSIESSLQQEEREDKLKTFRFQMKAAMAQFKNNYQNYIDDPCNHSRYFELWSLFWTTNYKQLSNGTNHFKMYDWHTQWAIEWRKIMLEFMHKNINTKSSELKEKLGIKAYDVADTEKIENQLKDELGIVAAEMDIVEKVDTEPTDNVIKNIVVQPCLEKEVEEGEITKESNDADRDILSKEDKKSRSHSKLRSRSPQRSLSPKRSPRRSLSPRKSPRRSFSRRKSRERSISPRRSTGRSLSRRKSRQRSLSPRRSPRRSFSRRKSRQRSLSPRRNRRNSRSPLRSSRRSRSPKKSARRTRSPERFTRRSRSSLRLHQRSRSPLRTPRKTSPRGNQTARRSRSSKEKSRGQSQNSHSNKKSSASKTTRSPRTSRKKSCSPLRLEDLMKNQNASHEFILSLLNILEIEDINANEDNSVPAPPTIVKEQVVDFTEKSSEPKELNDGPSKAAVDQLFDTRVNESITIISALRLLTALEDILGSLGPKSIDLMHKAVAMDKSMPGSSNNLIDDDVNYILLVTIKEKLKGLLNINLVEPDKQYAAQKVIEDIEYLTQKRNEKIKKHSVESTLTVSVEDLQSDKTLLDEISFEKTSQSSPEKILLGKSSHDKTSPRQNRSPREEIPSLQPTLKQYKNDEKNTSPASNEDGFLEDWEVRILMTKFTTLSEKEKRSFVEYMKRLEISNPGHVRRLRNEILNTEDETNEPVGLTNEPVDFTKDSFETFTVENDRSISTLENKTRYPKERFYSGRAETILDPMKNCNQVDTSNEGQPIQRLEPTYSTQRTYNQNFDPNLQGNPYIQRQYPYFHPLSSMNPMQPPINPYYDASIQYLYYR